jgi:endonuclease VIII
MAEGHAVRRWVRALEALVGEPLTEVRLPKRWDAYVAQLVGERLTGVEARGKHLLLHLSNGWTIHCHAMQYGSWQVGEPGMELRKEAKYVRLRLLTPEHEAVFYHGPVIELLFSSEEVANHPALSTLGPDLLDEPFNSDESYRRVVARGDHPIGDVVMDQRVMAGVGNIFKSEGLFLAGIDPRRTASGVSREEMERYWRATIPLMRAGMERFGPTKTLPPEMQQEGKGQRGWHWVYGRRGHPCLRCGTKIEMVRQGDQNRATFFCPNCQR